MLTSLISYIVKKLVENPDAVQVYQEIIGEKTTIKVVVVPDDMRRVIGREGKVARALRTLIGALVTTGQYELDFDSAA
jgi:predicted RNA-binding protein YlqC (UPF0109 family)